MSTAVDRVVESLNAGDLEAVVGCYREDATIEDGADVVLARGHEGIRERFDPIFRAYPALRVEALDRWEAGSFVVQKERVTGRSPTIEHHVAVYSVVADLIVRERLLR